MKQNDRLSIEKIFEITKKINSTEDLDTLLDTIIGTIREVLNCEGSSLLLYKKEQNSLIFINSKGLKSDLLTSMAVPRGKGIAGIVLDTLKPIIVNDAPNDSRIYREIDHKLDYITKNLICVPMIAYGEVQGVLEAVNKIDKEVFTEEDLFLLQNLSNIAAIAIRNRLSINALEGRVRDIDCLLKITTALSNRNNTDDFWDTVIQSISELMQVERLSYIHLDENKEWKIFKYTGFVPESLDVQITKDSVLNHVIETGEPLLVDNVDDAQIKFLSFKNYKTKSFITMPVKKENEIIGIINVTDKIGENSFTSLDFNLMKIISTQILEAYNALIAREQKERLDILRRDLKIASKIQRYSLPDISSSLHEIETSVLYFASDEVGGDFYDYVYHSENCFSFIIADVLGKGIPAALVMEFSKTVINTEINKTQSPSQVLYVCNQIIKNKFEHVVHVEAMITRVDTQKKEILFSSAGHNRQFFYRKETQKIELLRTRGLPLGTNIKKQIYTEKTLQYNSGDMLILYTDGITETRNICKELFGENRLIDLIESNADQSASQICTIIKSATDSFRGCQKVEDDFSLVIFKF